ncbi:MAG: DUF4276 family protein [Rhodospirillales bacterium]
MRAEHLHILVEEPSMEAFLQKLLPRLLGDQVDFTIHSHQGKSDLLAKLGQRLRAYAKWLPSDSSIRIVVVIDRDSDDCQVLKQRLEKEASAAGLKSPSSSADAPWQLVNRIAVEELEAWYFGEWAGVRRAYPKLPSSIPKQNAYRLPDASRAEHGKPLSAFCSEPAIIPADYAGRMRTGCGQAN